MPYRSKRICEKHGCNNIAIKGKVYCESHYKKTKKDRAKHYDKSVRHKIDKKYASFYKSKEWQIVRQQVLERDNYLCVRCNNPDKLERKTPADVVHHIEELKERWDLRLDPNNCESLCHNCHNIEHKQKK